MQAASAPVAGDKFDLKSHLGSLLYITVHDLKVGIETSFGITDAIAAERVRAVGGAMDRVASAPPAPSVDDADRRAVAQQSVRLRRSAVVGERAKLRIDRRTRVVTTDEVSVRSGSGPNGCRQARAIVAADQAVSNDEGVIDIR